MEKIILLKTQLVEASKLCKSNHFRYRRMAVILLDNFIEIQLNSSIKSIFKYDGIFKFQEKKYTENNRKYILKNYDKLLDASYKEGFISKQEQYKLTFCHEIRNKLYHLLKEDSLLVEIALTILIDIIKVKQPLWKNAEDGVVYEGATDPFTKYGKNDYAIPSTNSEQEWCYFLNFYFPCKKKPKQHLN